MDIEPGQQVTIKVSRLLNTRPSQRTLARLFMKDRQVAQKRLTTPKTRHPSRRAGRIWVNRPKGSCTRVPSVGDSATIRATVDVIRDLESVEKYVEIN